MKVSLNWLRRYVEISERPDILAHDLTMFGLNVEEIHQLGAPFKGVVYGRVLEVERHPGADKLSLCRVEVGGAEPLQIVCGAPNVRPGLGVPVALHGAVLAGGLKIKRSKIRGELSEGMICSEIELAIGENADGIIELDFEERPGTNLESRLGSSDVIFDIEVTPNRPDQLCHLGIAREVAALYGRSLTFADTYSLHEEGFFRLEIENGDDCPRYTAAFVDDIAVKPSPHWMQELLTAVGMKPINNVVDVTNFVLMELGQPLHAFDRDTLARDTIVVRRARHGERLVTLDGEKRDLDHEILVIADSERPIALAGVMGGEETEVTDRTQRVLLESAMFERRRIRAAKQRFRLETEASYRFERQADIAITKSALERACLLLKEIGAGSPRSSCRDLIKDNAALEPRVLQVRVSQVNRVMGTRLSASDISALLSRLELGSSVAGERLEVAIPSVRRDLEQEIDIIEEIARLYGYENIGRDTVPSSKIFSHRADVDRRNQCICSYLASRGFVEVVTTSFMDPREAARFGWRENEPRVRALQIENPLSAMQSHLRTSLLPGLLNVVRRNSRTEQEALKLFELGKVFIAASDGAGLPSEELHLAAILARNAVPSQWIEQQRPSDFFDMKGALEALLERMGVDPSSLAMSRAGSAEQGYIFNWYNDKELLAEGGMLSKRITSVFDIDSEVFYFDIALEGLKGVGGALHYNQVSPYPVVKRDLCLVAGEKVAFSDIINLIKRRAKYLESISLFDYYRAGHLGEGKRSYTFRLSFRSPDSTLDDAAVDKEIEKFLESLKRDLQVTLRVE
jgi:phenylalanyl-tRNA synthetase beta chain